MISFPLVRGDHNCAPFDVQGGLGQMDQLFRDQMGPLIEELNRGLWA